MPTLPKNLRGDLDDAVGDARVEAEKGARAALVALGVADAKKPAHLDNAGEDLRRRLRARGRQAGDVRRPDDSQQIEHLVQECAYEHWHRMLFARFLAENELLRHPEMGVAVSLEECEELAREEGLDLWELASLFAQHMLPQVFRQDDPVLHVRLPSEARIELNRILNALPAEVFTADDSLGWTYQFWQTKRKKEVNESGVKIGADEISPVTQLFTEDYMVEFLLHNTLGAWWAGKLGPIQAATEEEARACVALPARDGLPGMTWTYLRFIQDETKTWKPAAGTFDGWPKAAKDITFLDPCMGSGHFPAFALPILARLRMEEENLSAADAIHFVLRDNIHGLELDPRCTQIGAFNLALTAWKLGGYQHLSPLHVACCGLAPQAKLADWLKLAGDDERLQFGMRQLYDLFSMAPVLGSLIDPRTVTGAGFTFKYEDLVPLLAKALDDERADEITHELAVTAQGIAKAAEILAGQFTLVATNVPYLGRGKQPMRSKPNDPEELADYCERVHPDAKADLATCFVERCLDFCAKCGSTSLVTPQNWLFLGTYKKLRQRLLKEAQWDAVVRLGEHAFDSSQAAGAFAAMLGLTCGSVGEAHAFTGIDVSEQPTPQSKAAELRDGKLRPVDQKGQCGNPDARIAFEFDSKAVLLSLYGVASQGIPTSDGPLFVRKFWELLAIRDGWEFHQGTVLETMPHGGREEIILFENGKGRLRRMSEEQERDRRRDFQGANAWGRRGVVVSLMRELCCTLYTGEKFDNNVSAIVLNDPNLVPAVWTYCTSPDFTEQVRQIDQKLNVTNATLVKVPFDLAHWQKVAAEKYPQGLPKPFSSDPTQWLFNGHPKGVDQPLHVAVARLLGYQWPRQTGSSFPDCPALGPDGLEKLADEDGIVCLTSLRGEANAVDRLRALLGAAIGHFDERELVARAGKKGSKSNSLESWLRDEFFEQHCDLFHQRPFIWHIWDGRKDGFHALVNYHKLSGPNGAGRRTLESLTYGYLGDWITRQKRAKDSGEEGAEDKHLAALELQKELERILAGDPPYDLFIRWKPLHQQPIGWEPDLNDGVRLNARPFLTATLSRGKKDAGLFRSKPNIKWDKNKGNEPERPQEDYPWFWNGDKFIGHRLNDIHLKNSVKEAARQRQPKHT